MVQCKKSKQRTHIGRMEAFNDSFGKKIYVNVVLGSVFFDVFLKLWKMWSFLPIGRLWQVWSGQPFKILTCIWEQDISEEVGFYKFKIIEANLYWPMPLQLHVMLNHYTETINQNMDIQSYCIGVEISLSRWSYCNELWHLMRSSFFSCFCLALVGTWQKEGHDNSRKEL